VTTSYVSDTMRAYHAKAEGLGLSFINESGLDPGIDHLLAHKLVAEYRQAPEFNGTNALTFRSYCGGFPKHAGEFRYKFSWSPAGVLRALTNQARFIKDGTETRVTRAWEAVTNLKLLGETFEVYPNRDSLPYLAEYGFAPSWNVEEFVRGTIRLGGWKTAWAGIFAQIPTATPERIEQLGAELWSKYAYDEGEEDRVVLYVGLEARQGDKLKWSRFYALDESGTGRDTAMARLVSLPATYAIESIERGTAPKGVSGAPHEQAELARWMREFEKAGVKFHSA
jgi:saccharopine dehydrogenase (NADP+, L-glutamate forming)